MDRKVQQTSGAGVLVFSPHPDDAEFSMGGTLLSLVSAGYRVTVMTMTNGEMSPRATADQRRHEQEVAAQYGGYHVDFMDMKDGAISCSSAAIGSCRSAILYYRPTIVFAPFPCGAVTQGGRLYHVDHENAGRLARIAVMQARIPTHGNDTHKISMLLYYGVPNEERTTIFLNIEDVMERLSGLLSCFRTQLHCPRRSVEVLLAQRIGLRLYSRGSAAETFLCESPMSLTVTHLMDLFS